MTWIMYEFTEGKLYLQDNKHVSSLLKYFMTIASIKYYVYVDVNSTVLLNIFN